MRMSGNTMNFDYIDGIHYENGVSAFAQTVVGRVTRNGSGSDPQYLYEYTISDHLGNGRMYFDISGGVARKIQETDYYAFGKSISVGSVLGSENKYQYNGKEKQEEVKMFDYGARFYDPVIARFNVIDRFAEKFANNSIYVYAVNNPVSFIDKNGDYAVSVHYKIKYDAFIKAGYSKKDADLYAHYASTYADNPPPHAGFMDFVFHPTEKNTHNKRKGIDYSATADSQDEKNSIWHSMMSNKEQAGGMTNEQAYKRGLEFGWKNIFDSGGKDLGKIGQGIHALQDAIAHRGASTNEHLGKNISSLKMIINDMYGSRVEAATLTKTATSIIGVLQGKKTSLKRC